MSVDKQAAKKWRPIIDAFLENFERAEAREMILNVLAAPAQEPEQAAPQRRRRRQAPTPTPTRTGARRLRTVGADDDGDTKHGSPSPAPSPSPSPRVVEVKPADFYTVDEAASFVGVGRQTIYNVLHDDAGKLPYQKQGGRGEYMIQGRGLLAYKAERDAKHAKNGTSVAESDSASASQ